MSNAIHPLVAAMEKHGITVSAVFIPFSKSPRANEKDARGNTVYSLNWRVTVERNGRAILETSYSAGVGHAPGYKVKPSPRFNRPVKDWIPLITQWECENGFHAEFKEWGDFKPKLFRAPAIPGGEVERFTRKSIEPEAASVLACLLLDSNVLDYATFEDWAAEYGYDTDSRKGESIYRACLEIALRMRSGLGESILAELAEAARDY